MVSHEAQIATLDAHTQRPSHHDTTEKFVVAVLFTKTAVYTVDTIHNRRHKETLYG